MSVVVAWHGVAPMHSARIPPTQPCETNSVVPMSLSCDDCPALRAGLGLAVVNELSVSLRVAEGPELLRTLTLTASWWLWALASAFWATLDSLKYASPPPAGTNSRLVVASVVRPEEMVVVTAHEDMFMHPTGTAPRPVRGA